MCNVSFWKDTDDTTGTGRHKNYASPINVPDLNQVQWDGQTRDDMKDDISWIDLDATAWLIVYTEPNYQGRSILLEPGASYNMKTTYDDNGKNFNDDIESFRLFDHPPSVNPINVINNFRALYPGSDSNTLHGFNCSEFYSQDSHYRVYDPNITFPSDDTVGFEIKLDHIQSEHDDHATLTFTMNLDGDFTESIQVTYDMADATQIPDWVINLIDDAIDDAADAACVIADGAEIVVTDGIGVIATIETDELIEKTAKALTFCIDHLNTVLGAIFKFQEDGGTTNFAAAVSHSIARMILAYYQELFGPDTNAALRFDQNAFLNSFIDDDTWPAYDTSWQTDKHTPYFVFNDNLHRGFTAYCPDTTFLYAKGGAVTSVKVDRMDIGGDDDHLVLQAAYDPNGNLFSVAGAIDIFQLAGLSDDYVAPASGVLTYNADGQMVHITPQDGTISVVNYSSLADAWHDKMSNALNDAVSQYGVKNGDLLREMVDASKFVLNAMTAAIS